MDPFAVALIGGLVGGTAAAIIGGFFTLWAQSRQHAHERHVAREARLQERRAVAYERIMAYVYRLGLYVQRTQPVVGPMPEPPTPLPDDEVTKLNAATIVASPEVFRLVLAVTQAARTFEVAVMTLEDVRAARSTPVTPAWQEVEAARKAYGEAVKELADAAGRELRR